MRINRKFIVFFKKFSIFWGACRANFIFWGSSKNLWIFAGHYKAFIFWIITISIPLLSATVFSKEELILKSAEPEDNGAIIIPKDIFPEGGGLSIPIYVPPVVNNSNALISDNDWKVVKEISGKKVKFSIWKLLEDLIKMNFEEISGEPGTKVGQAAIFSIGSCILSAFAQAFKENAFKFTIQKGSRGNFRVIIEISTDVSNALRDNAGGTISSPKKGGGAIAFSRYLQDRFSLPESNFIYQAHWVIDKRHKKDSYIAYMFLSPYRNAVGITPKIYQDDKFIITKNVTPFGGSKVLELKGKEYVAAFSYLLSLSVPQTLKVLELISEKVKFPELVHPQITSPLEITPQKDKYQVGDILTAEFTIANKGNAPISFDVLTVGGRLNDECPQDKCPDFEWKKNITLRPGEVYPYKGTLKLEAPGNYHFFTAYRTKDGWNTAIPTAPGVTNTKDIVVEARALPIIEEIEKYRGQIESTATPTALLNEALKTAKSIEDAGYRSLVLSRVAEGMAKGGMKEEAQRVFQQALQVAKSIEIAYWRSRVLSANAKVMAKAGMKEEAHEVFQQALQNANIEDGYVQSWALRYVAVRMAEAGLFQQALQVAESIEDAWERSWALSAVAAGMAKVEMKEEAQEVSQQALQVAKSIENEDKRSTVLGDGAVLMAEAGLFQQALQVAKSIEDAYSRSRLEALSAVAEGMAKAGQFQQALQVAKSIEVAWDRSWALSAVAEEMAKARMKEEAQRVFQQALQVAKSIEKDVYLRSRSFALSRVAEGMAEAGMKEEAQRVFQQALQSANEDARYRSLALRDVAERMAKAGQFQEALQVAKSIEDGYERSGALRDIAEGMAKARLFEQAIQTARSIEDAEKRSGVLVRIALARLEEEGEEQSPIPAPKPIPPVTTPSTPTITSLKDLKVDKTVPLGTLAKGSYSIRAFNIDDIVTIKVNGQAIGSVSYYGDNEFNINPYLRAGGNEIELNLENKTGGWTYGFELKKDGRTIWQDIEGEVGRIGAKNNDQTIGTVYKCKISFAIQIVSTAPPPQAPTSAPTEELKAWLFRENASNAKLTAGWNIKDCSVWGPEKKPLLWDCRHTGIDYKASEGTPVYSATDGKVIRVEHGTDSNEPECLSTVAIYNESANATFIYLHMKDIRVKLDDKVKAGDLIGKVGQRGYAKGAHLHFEAREGKKTHAANDVRHTINPYEAAKKQEMF